MNASTRGFAPWGEALLAALLLVVGCQSRRGATEAGTGPGSAVPSTAVPVGPAPSEADQAWMKSAPPGPSERRQVTEVRLNDGAMYSGWMVLTNGGLVAQGEGSCTWPDGKRYEGEWVLGKPHGLGLSHTPGGETFRGRFVHGVREGEGSLTTATGAVLTGAYRADKAHGPFRIVDGPFVLEGQFEDGQMVGWWKRRGQLGTDIEEWIEGGARTKARGLVVFEDGVRQSGDWDFKSGTGKGEIRWKDGRRYQGAWRAIEGEENDPHGVGEMTWPDGRKYVGAFVRGKREGEGRLTHPGGRTEAGRWKNDELESSSSQGR